MNDFKYNRKWWDLVTSLPNINEEIRGLTLGLLGERSDTFELQIICSKYQLKPVYYFEVLSLVKTSKGKYVLDLGSSLDISLEP